MQALVDKGRLHCGSAQCFFTFIERKASLANINRIKHIVRKNGQLVYEQGEPAYGCYWLCQGRIKLARRNRRGKQQFIRFVQPGQLFAVEVLVGHNVYDEYAQATEESVIVSVEGRGTLSALLLEEQPLATSVVEALSSGILEVESRLKLLLSGGALERIAHALLTFPVPQDRVNDGRLHLTNGMLASMVGTSPQTVSSCLNKLQSRGLIEHRRGRVTVLKPAELETLR